MLVERGLLAEQARQVLDQFDVPNRLQHVRRYVWRDGTLRFVVHDAPPRPPNVCYQLEARWPRAVLRRESAANGLERSASPVVEGRWVRGTTGYLLRVGIDLAVPSAIYIRSGRMQSFVPFAGRPARDVEQAIQNDLAAYVSFFLRTYPTVPEARAADARRLPPTND
jgi:hypothetical protein